jgi:hypothetical protein
VRVSAGGWEFASREHLAAEQLQNRTEPILLSKSPCVLLLPNFVDPKAAELMMRDSVGTLRSQEFRDQVNHGCTTPSTR